MENLMKERIKDLVKSYSNIHLVGKSPNIFLFSTPRSGSTWLMELIWSQPGFKYCNEPLNLRNPQVRKYLGLQEWVELMKDGENLSLEKYIEGIISGKILFLNPNPFRHNYRPFTNRVVFKVLHGGEDRMRWFQNSFNGKIIFLIRHPIPVSLSRKILPRLEAFLTSDYQYHFTSEQIRYAKEILRKGEFLEKAVLSWCIQNAIPLKNFDKDWTLITYEQLTLEPNSIIQLLKEKISLRASKRMEESLTRPSAVKGLSDKETLKFLESRTKERSWLVEKWKKRVDKETEIKLMEILKVFELDIYEVGNLMPKDSYLVQSYQMSDLV